MNKVYIDVALVMSAYNRTRQFRGSGNPPYHTIISKVSYRQPRARNSYWRTIMPPNRHEVAEPDTIPLPLCRLFKTGYAVKSISNYWFAEIPNPASPTIRLWWMVLGRLWQYFHSRGERKQVTIVGISLQKKATSQCWVVAFLISYIKPQEQWLGLYSTSCWFLFRFSVKAHPCR